MSEVAHPRSRAALEAALWHERLAEAGDADEGVRAEFARWRDADPRHAAAFEVIGRTMRVAATAADRPAIRAMRAEAALRARRSGRRRPIYAAAAVLAVFVALAAVVGWRVQNGPSAPPAVYETRAGERMAVTLADGSVVTLNSRSRVRAVYSRAARRLQLDAGEAVFEVAKDARRPFTVAAGGQVVTAHGTAFDVRLGADRLEVALLEGRITVRPKQAAEHEGTAVLPGQRLVVAGGRTTLSEMRRPEQVASWRRGIVILEDATLAEAVEEMNRYRAAPIRIGDPALADLRLSGSFRTDGADAFVEALALYFPLRAERGADDVVVLTARPRSDRASID